jgi:hypothetical protein
MTKPLQETQEDEDFCSNCQKELDDCRCERYQDKCEAAYERYLEDYYGGSSHSTLEQQHKQSYHIHKSHK